MKVNIAVTINDTYFYPLYIMLHTLFAAHPGISVNVFLIHSRVSCKCIRKLRQICKVHGGKLIEIPVEESEFEGAPENKHFTKEMYYRILAARLLPETVERVLYLDPDMIILDSLEEIYHMPMEEYFFAGCIDRFIDIHHKEYKSALHIKEESSYINSGVLLLNLEKLREEQRIEDVYEMIKKSGKKLRFPDQDLINVLYEGKITKLEDRYNLNPNILYWQEYVIYNFLPGLKKPAVIHYMGKEKPWKSGYVKGLYQYYWKAEMKYTYFPKGKIFYKIWKIPVSIIKSGWGFAHGVSRRILERCVKSGIDKRKFVDGCEQRRRETDYGIQRNRI